MMVRTLASVADHVRGRLDGPDCRFGDVSTDTRSNVRGSLFVALTGDNFDGNDYVADAASGGAVGALVSRHADVALTQVEVGDTRRALGDMARAWRATFDVPVIAVTGSAGKTTARSLVAAILSVDRKICATQGNLNNDIGVPLTLMRIAHDDAAAVIELGANHAGEIDYLAGIAQPSVALITNAGDAHLEGFGSLDGIAEAKGELLDHLSETGTAILNADDAYYEHWCRRARHAGILSFGLDDSADCSAADIELRAGGTLFTLRLPDGTRTDVTLPLAGRHNVANAVAAAAVAFAVGFSGDAIAAGLATVEPVRGRLRETRSPAGARIIDDAYNANPSSARAALEYLAQLEGNRIFVLGDMGELGATAVGLHRQVGEFARSRCDRFIAIGPLAAQAAEAFGAAGEVFDDVAAAAESLQRDLDANTTVLVKASRAMRLERLAAALTADKADVAC